MTRPGAALSPAAALSPEAARKQEQRTQERQGVYSAFANTREEADGGGTRE